MTESRITRNDLDWWLTFAAAREWTFAKTYADSAPHHYVVEGRTDGVSHEDMVRASRVIHTFGSPGKYYSLTKIYLVSPDNGHRWWTESNDFSDTTLVNRATTGLFYGIQNALSTVSAIESNYDEVATAWDSQHPIAPGEVDRVKAILSGVRGKFPPHVLDIGCGTGRVLDLGVAVPACYAGVDSSQAMLNLLVRKYPKVAAVYPVDVREALGAGTFTPGQFDWVFLDASIELSSAQATQVEQIARLAVIVVDQAAWTIRDVSESSLTRIRAEAEALEAGS